MLCSNCHQWKDLEDFRSKLKNKHKNSNCRRCLDIKESNTPEKPEKHQSNTPKKTLTAEQQKLATDLNNKIKEIRAKLRS